MSASSLPRRAFLVIPLGVQLQTLTREPANGVSEVAQATRAILRGPLERAATDGSAYYCIGDDVIMLEPDCVLRGTFDALVGQRVKLTIEKDDTR